MLHFCQIVLCNVSLLHGADTMLYACRKWKLISPQRCGHCPFWLFVSWNLKCFLHIIVRKYYFQQIFFEIIFYKWYPIFPRKVQKWFYFFYHDLIFDHKPNTKPASSLGKPHQGSIPGIPVRFWPGMFPGIFWKIPGFPGFISY